MTFTTISKEHMNITMQHYNIIKKWGGGGGEEGGRRGGGSMACLKMDMYYHRMKDDISCMYKFTGIKPL